MLKIKNLPLIGSLATAFLASLCCIGPAVLAVLGVGGVSLFTRLTNFRPYFIGLTLILLVSAFYLTYRKKEVICGDGTCKTLRRNKGNKIALWGATISAVIFVAFPYLNLSNPRAANNLFQGEIVEVKIPVEGMTCSSCEVQVEKGVKKLDGIVMVKADYQKGLIYVTFVKEKVTTKDIVEVINQTGYKATKP